MTDISIQECHRQWPGKRSQRRVSWGIWVAIILTPLGALAADPVELSPIGGEKYTEQVVVIALAEDGTYAKVRLGISNVGPGDGKGGCEILIVKPSGEVFNDKRVIDADLVRYDRKTQTLSMGPCSARAGERLVLRAQRDAHVLQIALAAEPKRDRAHQMRAGEDFYELDVLVPWASAEIEWSEPGKHGTARGHGYADHSRSAIMPYALADRWLRFRGLQTKDPRVVLVRFPPKGPPIGWHHAKGHARQSLSRVMLRGAGTQWHARFKGEGGEWRLRTTKLLHRSAPIEEQGMLGRVLEAFVGNPVTRTFRGVLEERGTGARVEGIVEVTLTDEQRP